MNQIRYDRLFTILSNYEVDINCGLIISKWKKAPLKSFLNHKGYPQVIMSHNANLYSYKVHEIVAFVGGLLLIGKTVNHIDGIKTNNVITNLECISMQDNIHHALKSGLKKRSKLNESSVREIRLEKEKGTSNKEISIKFGVSVSMVSVVLNRVCWGYVS